MPLLLLYKNVHGLSQRGNMRKDVENQVHTIRRGIQVGVMLANRTVQNRIDSS